MSLPLSHAGAPGLRLGPAARSRLLGLAILGALALACWAPFGSFSDTGDAAAFYAGKTASLLGFLGWSPFALGVLALSIAQGDATLGNSWFEFLNLSPLAMLIALAICALLLFARKPPAWLGVAGALTLAVSLHPAPAGMDPTVLITPCLWGAWVWAASCLAASASAWRLVRRPLGLDAAEGVAAVG